MLDFTPIREKTIPWPEFVKDIRHPQLIDLTNELSDIQLALIQGCTDAHVTFQPVDPEAHDPYAADAKDEDLAWNLGHVIVHSLASSEESAYLAVELARGVEYETRRSRYEVPWETVTVVQQCRVLIEQSHRMILGMLAGWPDQPFTENTYTSPSGIEVNCYIRFLFGMNHAEGHLNQIAEIIRQGNEAGL
jgi:hypothetical protein